MTDTPGTEPAAESAGDPVVSSTPAVEAPATADLAPAVDPAEEAPASGPAEAPPPAAPPAPEAPPVTPTAPVEPGPEEDDDPFAIVGAWARAHPLFALLLMFITFVLPYGVWSWRASAERVRLTGLQDAWQDALSQGGLPVPYVPSALVPAPDGVDLPGSALDGLGLGARQRALVAWQTLLGGGQVSPDQLHVPAPVGGPNDPAGAEWLAAVRACALLREAAAVTSGAPALLAQARADADLGPGATREALRLAADLVEGRAEAVAVDAARLLEQSPHPAARGALVALRDEARGRRISLALSRPSAEGLREAARLARDGAPVVAPLSAAGGAALAAVVTDVGAALAVLDLFAAAAPRGVAERPELQSVWDEVAPAVQRVVAERLRQFDDDPTLALQVLTALVRVDPTADAPPVAFLGWREHLQQVVNDPARLRRLAERSFELGWTPAGLEDLLTTRADAGGTPAGGPTPAGALLVDALVRTVAALQRSGEAQAREVPALLASLAALEATLEERLDGRLDPIARRLRAQVAYLRGRAAVGTDPAAGRDALERARTLGYEPRARLLEALARAHEAAGEVEAALAAARERVEALEELAPQVAAGLSPDASVAWDLRGWPADPLHLAGERVSALVDLAALLGRAGQGEAALAAATRAAGVHPEHAARAHLARAELLLAQRRSQDARAALAEAQAAVRPHQRALRERIQVLLAAMPE